MTNSFIVAGANVLTSSLVFFKALKKTRVESLEPVIMFLT